MGNREDLLAAAERCLHEKGYARTTSRDVATEAGVSLAAIGYHFGSKEALLNAALRQALEKWGDDIGRAMAEGATGQSSAGQFEDAWTSVIRSFGSTHPLWAIQFELIAQLNRTPELRAMYGGGTADARSALVEMFGGDERAGAFYQALLIGMAALWMADPDSAPSGADLADAIRSVATHIDGK
jgi:AcrR family transcriptional regulator